jgi:hypothetical protein
MTYAWEARTAPLGAVSMSENSRVDWTGPTIITYQQLAQSKRATVGRLTRPSLASHSI